LGAALSKESGGGGSLGLVIHSFPVRTAGDRDRRKQDRFSEPARFLDYARTLGARGVQVGLGALDDTAADALRERALAASMYLEGITSLPRDQADMGRFEAEISTAKRSGADVVRTVMLSGRRYETFPTAAAFRRFAETSSHALSLAAPVVARHDVRLAVENHKDWRADELLAILKRVGNDHVGVCLDTGNSIALLEDPMEVVEALAPRAFTTHLKDMGVEEYPQGFLLAEVPLGAGILDLARVVRIVRAARSRSPASPRATGPRSQSSMAATWLARSRSCATIRRASVCRTSVLCLARISFGRKRTISAAASRLHASDSVGKFLAARCPTCQFCGHVATAGGTAMRSPPIIGALVGRPIKRSKFTSEKRQR
jgi:sugar phosphate isomerase/epimerase